MIRACLILLAAIGLCVSRIYYGEPTWVPEDRAQDIIYICFFLLIGVVTLLPPLGWRRSQVDDSHDDSDEGDMGDDVGED